MIDFVGGQGMEEMGVNIKDMFGSIFPAKTVRRKIRFFVLAGDSLWQPPPAASRYALGRSHG